MSEQEQTTESIVLLTPEEIAKNIRDLSDATNQLCYYIPINQNILMGALRTLGAKPKDVANFIFDPEKNKDFEQKVDKELRKMELKKDKKVAEANDELLNRGQD